VVIRYLEGNHEGLPLRDAPLPASPRKRGEERSSTHRGDLSDKEAQQWLTHKPGC